MTYGYESWVLTDTLITNRNEKVIKIRGVTKINEIGNEETKRRIKMIRIVNKIETKQLKWFGHLARVKGGNGDCFGNNLTWWFTF